MKGGFIQRIKKSKKTCGLLIVTSLIFIFFITYIFLSDGTKTSLFSSNKKSKIVCQTSDEILTAIKNAKAGDTIYIKEGTYDGVNLCINSSGKKNNYITITNYPKESPVFTHSYVDIKPSSKYINFSGLQFKDLSSSDSTSYCIKIHGGCSNINISELDLSNIIYIDEISNCISPITVYGDSKDAISDIHISKCNIHECNTGYSEALTLNGNVKDCIISDCNITNTGNIGIDIAGNYSHTGENSSQTNQSRNITVFNNTITNCNSPFATSAGLYCDGAKNVTFSNNKIYNCQCGISLGAEEAGNDSCDFYVYNNLIINCGIGITSGAYLETGAKHYNSFIFNNSILCKDANSYGSNNAVILRQTNNFAFFNNIVYCSTKDTSFLDATLSQENVNIFNNCWFTKKGTVDMPSMEKNGIQKDPKFNKNTFDLKGDYKLKNNSPCKNLGIQKDYTGKTFNLSDTKLDKLDSSLKDYFLKYYNSNIKNN